MRGAGWGRSGCAGVDEDAIGRADEMDGPFRRPGAGGGKIARIGGLGKLDGLARIHCGEGHFRLRRILALKASLGLHVKDRAALVPAASALAVIGSEAHRDIAADVTDKTVTPATHKKIRLYGISGGSDFTIADPLGYLDVVAEELESVGFEVHIFKTADQRRATGEEGVNFMCVISDEARPILPISTTPRSGRECEGLRSRSSHTRQVILTDGRGNPVVRHRVAHRVRFIEPAQPPHRRADGQNRHPRPCGPPRSHPGHRGQDSETL